MRSFFAALRQLVLPAGALPGSARIVIGPDIPADLQAYYTGLGFPVVAAILHYTSATRYYYDADLQGTGAHAYGWSDSGVISEKEQAYLAVLGPSTVEWGNPVITRFNIGNVNRAPSTNENWRFNPSMTLDVQGPFTIDHVPQPRGEIGASYGTAGTLVTCTGPEIAMPSYGVGGLNTTFNFLAGRLYQIDIIYGLIYSAAAFSVVRARTGLGSLAGQILGQVNDDYTGPGGPNAVSRYSTFYVRNATAAAISNTLGLSVQRVTGAANISLYGGSPPLSVRVHDITDTAPALNGVAVSLI